jgi:hypothetical protein
MTFEKRCSHGAAIILSVIASPRGVLLPRTAIAPPDNHRVSE